MANQLEAAISGHTVFIGDLILTEVLRGVANEKLARLVETTLERFNVVRLGGREIAVKAAENYRLLRGKGVTVRGTVDLIIGTWCIAHAIPLLHSDRDFEGMERWLGLKRWQG